MDVARWLEGLGLSKYVGTFAEHEVDADALPLLSDEHLKELGLPLGARLKLLKAIAALTEAPAASEAPSSRIEAERRQLTVMFVDLVGSTELALALDPEELRELLGAYQEVLGREVAHYGGHVAKVMGDGVLVYFGYPAAHEDDAVRAIYAGLAVVRAVKRLGKRVLADRGGRLRARIGIATGLVVVGDMVGAETSEAGAVTGETPNLAYRLQEAAGSGRVAVAERTRALAGGAFTYEEVEERKLKGFPEPVRLWRVLGASGAESRFEALHGRWLTPLVGREHELALLLDRWGRAKEGEGQVVLVSGEAGIGKSRLTEAFRERLMADEHVRIRLQCSPYHTNSALHPVIEHLERAAGFEREDGAEARLAKLEALLARGGDPAETVPLIAALLGVATGERYPALAMSPERQKERTLAVLTDQVLALAKAKPVLMIVEDVHWIDPTSQDSIDLTIGRAEAARLLVVVTYRPEYEARWLGRPHVTPLSLTRLSKREGAEMVTGVTGGRALPPEVLDQVVAKTDGVPLFVEELTRMVVESGLVREAAGRYVLDGPLPPLAIPATLQDSLMARLDRLAPAKEVAQAGAAIGRTFRHDLLAAVVTRTEAELATALDQLVNSGLVFRQGVGPEAAYTFKHALVQDAAHGSLLKSQRQRLHAKIASVLESRFPDQADSAPEVVAQHYAEADLAENAIAWWTKAGQQAFDRSANLEAIASLNKALATLDTQSDGSSDRITELDILITLGSALTAVQGYTSTETQRIVMRARTACKGCQDINRTLPILYGAWSTYIGLGQYDHASQIASECVQYLEHISDEGPLYIPYVMLGYEHMMRGHFVNSNTYYDSAEKYYLSSNFRDVASKFTEHPGALIHSFWTHTKLCLGQYDSAYASMNSGFINTHASKHINSIGIAKWHASYLLVERGHFSEALRVCNELADHASEYSLSVWQAGEHIIKGLILNSLDAKAGGAALGRRGLAQWRAMRIGFQKAQILCYFARTCLLEGHIEEAEEAVLEGLGFAQETGENGYLAELHRTHGELRTRRESEIAARAEADYDRAITIARQQRAKSFELRAATSLARLWAETGERHRAYDLLAPIYGWFTEGFGTRDLIEAKALLEQIR